ncbi:hypothetical protein SAMN04488074_14315 [Lentzea albidocapillata subsp. violacea]|uniref:Restriction endonuclease n=1 Tax=Lentzea albidocapillata subsp. violacea TaxID=128104 RepID=A0A1H0A2K5_9PSEU|nr:hypothetical protein [Lentzea albidocapillata]SDN27788.1 hypothetical protein SAMN04488074_14315 [Lentzea albidocapillata subsp. violacea]
MNRTGDPAEARFEHYLRERGYGFEHEPDLATGKRPDYLVRANPHEFVCEIKSFNTAGTCGSGRVGALSQAEVLKPIRKHITTAAVQLKGIPDRPLVVVLANPKGCPIPLDPFSVMAAMYGDVGVEFSVTADGDGGDVSWTTGFNRKLAVVNPETGERIGGDHEYVSAVAVLRREDLAFQEWSRRWRVEHGADFPCGATTKAAVAFLEAAAGDDGVPHSDDVFLDVFETVSSQAVPLPRDVFNGPNDRRWVPDNSRTALVPFP